uniref:DNA mismatch repair proteins mutS family domain-containing protein n=1 Tax=viral metagenome TaxID=1070528 RepID=A0A6C0BUK2_9ZZZZ
MSSNKKEKESIFKLYFDLTDKYKKEYGERTVVLLQVGSFYEIYGMKDNNGTLLGSNIQEISSSCHLNIRPKQLKYNDKDIVMAGIPDKPGTLEKYLTYINNSGFTSVIWSQDENDPTIRSFNQVISPGTYFSSNEMNISNNICCIWLEVTKATKQKNPILYCGISNVNNTTGDTCLYEYETIYSKSHTIYDELQRFISIKTPSEVIIISSFNDDEVNKVIQYSNINTNTIHIIDENDSICKKCCEQVYQYETFFNYFKTKIYISDSNIMEKTTALQSITFLLDFIYKHNPSLTRNINYPSFENNNTNLILANHTLQQLNIIPDNKYTGRLSSLVNLLNFCKTSIGRRRYEYDLTHPTTVSIDLKREYNMTEFLLNNFGIVDFIRNIFNVYDLAYLVRKIVMKKISPLEITFILKSIEITREVYIHTKSYKEFVEYLDFKFDNNNIFDETTNIIEEIKKAYNIDICENIELYDIEDNIFNSNYDTELDQYVDQYNYYMETLNHYRSVCDKAIKSNEKKTTSNEYVKIESIDKKGLCLITTKTRFGKLIKSKHILENEGIDCVTSEPSTQNNVIIESNSIKVILKEINELKKNIKNKVNSLHLKFLDFLIDHQQHLNNIIKYIEIIDNVQNKAFVAKKYNYYKPSVLSLLSSSSYISVKDIRHPLIENLHSDEYVSNDLEIGRENSGILLYGTNAVGKTSLIRAVGMSIIMAQSGYYVPASHFEFVPYRKIFSRILNNDNLFKGLSTFAVEMSELNVILKECDENSLILGDELCSGTEMDSAKAIFVSGLQVIHEKKSSFMFATHLHEIATYSEIESMERLSMKHMTVQYDRVKDTLIYDRKLKDGPGESMYGLEVCKSLNMPTHFLENAYELRNKYIDSVSILDSRKSRYNSKKLLNMCEKCKKNPAIETHHIIQQKYANNSGFIGDLHKNHLSNLIGLCEKCHQKEHYNVEKI